jgi:3-hydroxyisobutyrate dehydrogenase
MSQKIGFIGLGVMGRSMCANLMKEGHVMYVYTRTRSTADEAVKNGAIWCNTPKVVAEKCDVIFTIVGFPKDVEEVFLGKNGILEGVSKGNIIVDMTTSEPSLAQKIYKEAKKKGVSSLDAPVSGGDVGATMGTLAIMVGGDKEAYDKVLPLFEVMGKVIAYMGKAGAGQHTKMCNQINIAATMIGLVESLLYAHKAGLDMQEVIDVIGRGASATWSLNNLGPRIVKGNFDPGFFIKHFIKDMGIALTEAEQMNLSLPGLALTYQFYKAAQAVGLEDLGTHGLYKVFAMMNGIKL